MSRAICKELAGRKGKSVHAIVTGCEGDKKQEALLPTTTIVCIILEARMMLVNVVMVVLRNINNMSP